MNSQRIFPVALLTVGLVSGLAAAVACVAGEAPAAEEVVVTEVPAEDPEELGQSPLGLRVLDLEGKLHVLGERLESRGMVLLMLGTECPISNKYLPELARLAKMADARGIEFYGLLSDPFLTRVEAERYRDEYGVPFPLLFETDGVVARNIAPLRTPEAFVYDRGGALVYRGRIDDRAAELGRVTNVPRERELHDAIDALGKGIEVSVSRQEAVGCVYEGWGSAWNEEITWSRHVAPLLQSHCVDCHRPGRSAPFTLEGFADAARRSKMIALVTEERYMPPWKAAPDFGDFLGVRRLADEQVDMLQRWAEQGAPRGMPEEAPPDRVFDSEWQFGEPDLILEASDVFTIPADGRDRFFCSVVPTGLLEDKEIVAFEFRPGNPRVVHHSLLYTDDSGRGREMDAAADGPGYESFGSIGFPPTDFIGGWVTGMPPNRLPDGVARRITKNTDLVIYYHYHPSGKEEKDQSSVAFWFADEPAKATVAIITLFTRDFKIPAGDPDHRLRVETKLEYDTRIISVIPHMHYLGKEMKVVAQLPSGEERPIVWVPDWDFFWQEWYHYREPFVLPAGTQMVLEARYDNSEGNPLNPSSPPRPAMYGNDSDDEMCFCFLECIVPMPAAKDAR